MAVLPKYGRVVVAKIMGVIKHFQIICKDCSRRQNSSMVPLTGPKSHDWLSYIGPSEDPNTILLLNGHNIKLP